MSLKPSLLAAAAFLVAGGLSVAAAQAIVRTLEERSVDSVTRELQAQGFGWASVLGDGLQVVIEGEAPTEADRFNAISAAGRVVDGARVIDDMRVADARPVAPSDFEVEILRSEAGVSVIGLMPADADHDGMIADLRDAAPGQDVADLLQTAQAEGPEGWDTTMDFAIRALELLPDAKISVTPGRVAIETIAASPEEQRRLESTLTTMKPENLRLALAVSAPRPVIAPFTFRATLDGGRLAFDACSASGEEERDAILAAAAQAGAEGSPDCRIGLGAPSTAWGPAVAAGLGALRDLGGGTLTVSDLDIHLAALPGVDAALFDRVTGDLGGALPDEFALTTERPLPPDAAPAPQGPPEFAATLGEDGKVRLTGRIDDSRLANLVRAFAQARFGAQSVLMSARAGGDDLPEGWSMRVMAGIEALSHVAEGSVTVTPDRLAVEGRSGRKAARDEIAARAIETLGPGAALDIRVTYDEALDPLAALPTPEECLAKIGAVTEAAKITFDPGSATISREGQPVIEAIAEILRSCPDLRLRIAGYTDSQGRESSNLSLSQSRAEAVLAALRSQRVPTAGFEAQGFGEADPIASNDTEDGREKNRRIEFTLIGDAAATPPQGDGSAVAPAPDPDAPLPPQPMAEAPDAPPTRPDGLAPEGAGEAASQDDGGEAPDDSGTTDSAGEGTGGDAEATPTPEAGPAVASAPATPPAAPAATAEPAPEAPVASPAPAGSAPPPARPAPAPADAAPDAAPSGATNDDTAADLPPVDN